MPVSLAFAIVLVTQRSELMKADRHVSIPYAIKLLTGCIPSSIDENFDLLPPKSNAGHVVQVLVIFQAGYVVPFGTSRGSEFATHPHLKGRSAKQGPREEKQGGDYVEGGHYEGDGEHVETFLSGASCHRMCMQDTQRSVPGRGGLALSVTISLPLKHEACINASATK